MGRILNTLEEQLINQLAEGETLKTWAEWQNWLNTQGCPLSYIHHPTFPWNVRSIIRNS